MNSRTNLWLPVILAASLVAGCTSNGSFTPNPFAKRKAPRSETLPAAEWAALRRANAARLAGEGIPREGAATRPAAPKVGNFDEFVDALEYVFWTFPKRTIRHYLGHTPGRYARMMEDEQSGDARRTGILRLVSDYDFARAEPYTERYLQIAQGDPNTLVRVAAVRALNRSRDPSVTPIAIRYLDDASPLLRLEAAKALANVPDEDAVGALVRHMAATYETRGEGGRPEAVPESRDVRVAAADALRNYPTQDVARALIDVLREREFEVSWQARKSLILMTGHDFGYDPAKWRDYLAQSENPFG